MSKGTALAMMGGGVVAMMGGGVVAMMGGGVVAMMGGRMVAMMGGRMVEGFHLALEESDLLVGDMSSNVSDEVVGPTCDTPGCCCRCRDFCAGLDAGDGHNSCAGSRRRLRRLARCGPGFGPAVGFTPEATAALLAADLDWL
jgi:hypothetical protein